MNRKEFLTLGLMGPFLPSVLSKTNKIDINPYREFETIVLSGDDQSAEFPLSFLNDETISYNLVWSPNMCAVNRSLDWLTIPMYKTSLSKNEIIDTMINVLSSSYVSYYTKGIIPYLKDNAVFCYQDQRVGCAILDLHHKKWRPQCLSS